jgi:radical SAM protein with 4Fe4S-binding SPASM domain
MANLNELCLEITNRCIMNCLHCSTASPGCKEQIDELSLKEIESIISDFHAIGGKILEISGGEPTLHKSLLDIVAFAKSQGLETRLYSCGVSYRGKCRPLNVALLKKLRSQGLDKIIFNLQGATSEVHDLITRKPGSFDALCQAIINARKLGFWIGAHFVPMQPNANSFEDVLKLAIKLGIDEVALLRFVPQGRGEVNKIKLKLASDKLWEFLKIVAQLTKKYRDKLKIRAGCPLDFLGFIDETIKQSVCKAGKSTCSITPSGDVIPCPAFKHFPEFVAGNIRDKNLTLIWSISEVFKEFQQIDYQNISVCSECAKSDICKGRCPAQRVRQHGNLDIGPDPDCPRVYMVKLGPEIAPFIDYLNSADILELSMG